MVPEPYVIDVVDVSDSGGIYWKDSLEGHNTKTISLGAASNAVQQMVERVIDAMEENVAELRCLALWGHGLVDADRNPLGMHLVTGGAVGASHLSALTNFALLSLGKSFERLQPYFHKLGRVELRGCGVAATDNGLDVMKMIAHRWRVPVQGSKKNQPTMAWLAPVIQVSPGGNVTTVPGIEYNLRA